MMMNNENYLIAKEKAIKYIGISKKTKYEVSQKLKKLNMSESIINKVLKELKALDYINDNKYIISYIRQNIRYMKYSIYEIKQKLLQKGIDVSIIELKLEEMLPKDYENNIIEKLKTTKLKDYEPIKQKEYLYRRGFKLRSD